MQARFTLSEDAVADLREIGRFTLRQWGAEQRNRYLAQLDRQFARIAVNPNLGRARPEIGEGIRSAPEGSHLIIFQVKGTGVEILNVVHQSMDIKPRDD